MALSVSKACLLAAAATTFALAPSAVALDLVQDGRAVANIVIPREPLAVESYAAKELQYHIERASAAKLAIISEGDDKNFSGNRIYLGHCDATIAEKVSAGSLPGNGYAIKLDGSNLFIAGKDSRGDPLGLDTHEGTLFAAYDILENELGVRWLWPGPLGEVIPQRKNISIHPHDGSAQPLLWFKQWRGGSSEGERVWLKRQRFGRSIRPQYGHSFGNYWARFGKSHPEYFAMLPNGSRGLDPTADSDPDYIHMCVSQPGLVRQIISDWTEKGSPQFLNVCENDGWAGCACSNCLSWDEPDPENSVPFDERVAAMQRAYAGKEGRRDEWMLKMGSLSDRYARFWERVSEEAAKARPDVKVVSYVYDNYRKPPVKAMLNSNVLCGLVPQESIFGYSKLDSEIFRRDWTGWEHTGCELFLRPNYMLQMPNFPAFYAHTLGEDLKFALAHHLKGTDFDSLTSKYSTQGPSLYMLAKILNHPDASVDGVLDEFYGAFGPAQKTVKQYFELWESVYPSFSTEEQAAHIKAKRKYGCGIYGPFYLLADEIFTPSVMERGRSLLQQAQKDAAGEAVATARIEWLAKGLTQCELMLATQRAYENSIDSGDKKTFLAAYQALKDFRQANVAYDQANFAGLSGDERHWKKAAAAK